VLVKKKNKTVEQELRNNNWISSIQNRITTTTQVEEFISLWIRLQDIQLQLEIEDTIVWKWTADGVYVLPTRHNS
jgi:hypothetical protein